MNENNKENETQQKNEKIKNLLHKKWWLILLAIIIVIVIVSNLSGDKVKWSNLLLGEYAPEPKKGTINVFSDYDDYLSVSINKVTNDYYDKYKNACIQMGYTVESNQSGNSYEAFNNEGYKLSIAYYGDYISFSLNAPEKMSEFAWPTNGIGAMLPKTTSNLGKITSDSSKYFTVKVGNTTIDDFNKYVKACEEKGFNVDYTKNDKSYYAKNANGYKLDISYVGNNNMTVSIQMPKEETTNNNNSTESTKPAETTNNSKNTETAKPTETLKSNNNGEMSKEFKDAMDSYETFMDEYIAFMKKYSNSNGTDVSLIADYSKYMSKYADVCSKFEKWKDEDMNTAEAAYYIEVQSRVNQKLLEVAK